ncbi:MAG: MATE family efflux transporter [Pseudomonadota bacterium]
MIISNVSVPMLAMVDSGVLGHLDSPDYLAGVALSGAIFSLLFIGFNFLRMGTTGIAAQQFGAGDDSGLRETLWQAGIVALALGTIIILVQQPVATLAMYLFDGAQGAEFQARTYFDIRVWGAPATLLNFALIGWFIGLSNTRVPLIIVLTINLTNIVLDLVFVNVIGMAADGVAAASVIAETLGAAVGIAAARRALAQRGGTLDRGTLWQPANYAQFFSVNVNIFIRTLALVGTLAFVTAQGARFGATVLAANALLMNFQHLLSYALDGLAHAAEALVGRTWGARDREGLLRAVRLTLAWSGIVAVGFSVAFWLGGGLIIGVLTDLPDVRAAAHTYIPWMILSPVVSVWSFVYDGVFVGTTWARRMRNVMLAAAAFVFIPAWYFALPLGNHGLWLAFTLFMAARGVGMFVAWQLGLRQPATRQWLAG